MYLRTRPALASFAVNVVLFPAVLLGFTLGANEARASTPSVTIHTTDLGARAQFDTASLYARIGSAAARVCEPARLTVGTRIDAAYRRCVKQTIDETVGRVNDAALSAYHRRHTGGPVPAVLADRRE